MCEHGHTLKKIRLVNKMPVSIIFGLNSLLNKTKAAFWMWHSRSMIIARGVFWLRALNEALWSFDLEVWDFAWKEELDGVAEATHQRHVCANHYCLWGWKQTHTLVLHKHSPSPGLCVSARPGIIRCSPEAHMITCCVRSKSMERNQTITFFHVLATWTDTSSMLKGRQYFTIADLCHHLLQKCSFNSFKKKMMSKHTLNALKEESDLSKTTKEKYIKWKSK